MRLVAKVHASFKELTHRKIGQCHRFLLRLVPPEACEQVKPTNQRDRGPVATGRPLTAMLPCEMRGLYPRNRG
ncbi:hypothetical protein CSIRO_2749 [Bradyrhizobiaceae bacterium SG-6C]|nr:hypothetical protein CSIRO_2749 [Bradyrhizobiaceae bacterium SG-6C]